MIVCMHAYTHTSNSGMHAIHMERPYTRKFQESPGTGVSNHRFPSQLREAQEDLSGNTGFKRGVFASRGRPDSSKNLEEDDDEDACDAMPESRTLPAKRTCPPLWSSTSQQSSAGTIFLLLLLLLQGPRALHGDPKSLKQNGLRLLLSSFWARGTTCTTLCRPQIPAALSQKAQLSMPRRCRMSGLPRARRLH